MEGQDQLTLARELVEALASGERGQADHIVNALARGVESSVCSQVATMTEGLRKALADLEVGVAGMTLHEIPDVRDRLQYIIAKTERAAHRTISSVEALLPMVERISGGAEKLIEDWSRIEWEGLDSTNLSALRDRVIEVVGQLRGDSRALHDRLCEILVAQDYQDLIGQVIQRVVQLLQEVEAKLATMASLSDSIAKEARPHGDEAGPERSDEEPQARPRVLTSQGEVDELLAALGR